jgi:membrane associated rhomboid family serine protease
MHRLGSAYLATMRWSNSMIQPRWNPEVLDKNRLFYSLWATGLFLVLIWGVYGINEAYTMNWRRWGNHPREWDHFWGVFTYPFLHGDLEHLWNNTATFFTLNSLLFYFYRSIAARVWLGLFFCSGIGLWVFAQGGNHIGASGVNYALAAYLFASGAIRNSQLLLRVSLLVAFLYGGMVWWMLPIDEHISWEGHVAGAVSGALLAVLTRRWGPLPDLALKPIDPEEPLPEWWMNAHPEHPDVIAQQQRPVDGEPQELGTQVTTTSTSNQTQLNYRITSRNKDGN